MEASSASSVAIVAYPWHFCGGIFVIFVILFLILLRQFCFLLFLLFLSFSGVSDTLGLFAGARLLSFLYFLSVRCCHKP